jgi:small GTP-binding protein
MSVVHPSVSHSALAQEYYARPTTSSATVPPPLGSSSILAMPPSPPPSFPHRHTSPFPESIQSFSALGPPEALTNPPPPTPKVVNAPLPDVPTVATDRHVPAVFPPTPDLSTPSNKVLFPDAMIKLAPPADDGQPDIDKGREKEVKVKETVEVARVPLNSLDHLVGDQVPTRSRSKSQQLLGGASVVDPVGSRGKSVSPRPKPPKRSHTAVPSHSYRSSAPQGLDVRVRMHSHVSGLPRSKLSSLNPDSGSMHRTYPSEQSSRHLAVPSDHGVSDFGPSDDVQAKVVLLGAPDTGKTTFILRYTRKRFITDPNVTLNSTLHTGKSTHKGIKVKLQIWDTAGQEKFHGLSPLYFRGAHVCILLYDISSRSSFMELKKVLADLKEKVPDTVMIYVVGHKSDQEATRAV